MSGISLKLRELLKNLKSDAVPKPPREDNPEAEGESPQEVNVEDATGDKDDIKKTKKKAQKKPFFKTNKKQDDFANPKPNKSDKRSSTSSTVNTQATGNVINIVNSEGLHFGNEYTYYMGKNSGQGTCNTTDNEDEQIEKNTHITLLMETQTKPEHVHIDFISKNLGKNWHSTFRALGYTKGRIETVEYDTAKNGVSEARYQLLLDWVRNDVDGTLGSLATVLWKEGERQVVKTLSEMIK